MNADKPATAYYFRFSLGQRYLHGLVIVTFLGLAASGMPLRFSDTLWAKNIANAVGGFGAVLFFHKLCAVLVTAGFLFHIAEVFYRAFVKKERGMFWGPASLVPQPQDDRRHLSTVQVVFLAGSEAALGPLYLLGEVRLLGGLLGNVYHRDKRVHDVVLSLLWAIRARLPVQRCAACPW